EATPMGTRDTRTRLDIPTPARDAALALTRRRHAPPGVWRAHMPALAWPLLGQLFERAKPRLIGMRGAGLRIGRYRIASGVAPFSSQPIYAPAWSRRPARRAGWQPGAPAQSSRGAPPSGLPPDILALIQGAEPSTDDGADWTARRQAEAPDDWPASLSSAGR